MSEFMGRQMEAAYIQCITKILELDPESLGKGRSLRRAIAYLLELYGADDAQILEITNHSEESTTLFAHFASESTSQIVQTDYGITRYVATTQRFVVVEEVTVSPQIARGWSGAVTYDRAELAREPVELHYVYIPGIDDISSLFYPLIRHGLCVGVLKLCDYHVASKFTELDVLKVRPIADAIASLLHLFQVVDKLIDANQQLDTALREEAEAVRKLQVGERLTFQYLTATSHLHELAGILGGMASDREELMAELTFSSIPKVQRQRIIDVIDRYAKHRKEAHTKVLEMMRSRPDAAQLQLKPANIKDLINEQLDVYESRLSRDKIRLRKALSDADLLVLVDASSFKYVIRILLNNAIQALVDGKTSPRRLNVFARRGPKNIHIRVQDNGIGIQKSVQGRVFEAFFTTRENGTGIGLFWARKILEEQQGRLRLERSLPEEGSTFLISLPAPEVSR